MDKVRLEEFIAAISPDSRVVEGKQYVEVTVEPEKLHSLASELKNNPETKFDFLLCLTGMDWGEDMGVIYHLRSTSLKHYVVLKVRLNNRENAHIASVCDIWPGAEFHEREAYDLLGIIFDGHPDLRRLFLDSTWGFPLRKDFKDDKNIVSR